MLYSRYRVEFCNLLKYIEIYQAFHLPLFANIPRRIRLRIFQNYDYIRLRNELINTDRVKKVHLNIATFYTFLYRLG